MAHCTNYTSFMHCLPIMSGNVYLSHLCFFCSQHNNIPKIVLPVFKFFVICTVLVQERLTKQIAMALTEAVNPAGVGVVIEAT